MFNNPATSRRTGDRRAGLPHWMGPGWGGTQVWEKKTSQKTRGSLNFQKFGFAKVAVCWLALFPRSDLTLQKPIISYHWQCYIFQWSDPQCPTELCADPPDTQNDVSRYWVEMKLKNQAFKFHAYQQPVGFNSGQSPSIKEKHPFDRSQNARVEISSMCCSQKHF